MAYTNSNWPEDINKMHTRYRVHNWIQAHEDDPEMLLQYLEFRLSMLKEELKETADSVSNRDSDGIVDGLIDLCVIAIGTLDAFKVDANIAWKRVLLANMKKEVGVKPGRPNPLGLPDLIKPVGWREPHHHDITALLDKCWSKENEVR